MDYETCLGPLCQHFPSWVKTAEDAREFLAYEALKDGPAVNYVNRRALLAKDNPQPS